MTMETIYRMKDRFLAKMNSWLWDEEMERLEGEKTRRKHFKDHVLTAMTKEWFVDTEDDVRLKVSMLKMSDQSKKVMLVCPPLGAQSMFTYLPIIDYFWDEYVYVSWNYRGFFDSSQPKRATQISIRDHALDARRVLQAAGYDKADVVIGHSMGVAVSLEFVLLYPEMVGDEGLVLLNGAHGHVFFTAFQPVVRSLPLLGTFGEKLVNSILNYDASKFTKYVYMFLRSKPVEKGFRLFGRFFGPRAWVDISGEDYLNEFFDAYFSGVTMNEQSSVNWLKGFQNLHRHSVLHLLHTIEHPALLISGRWDYLTPSYHMSEMAKEMKNAIHKVDNFSTHATIVENPQFVLEEMETFLRSKPKTLERKSSTCFVLREGENNSNLNKEKEQNILRKD